MKLPKINNNFKNFVNKYDTAILVSGIIGLIITLLLLPFNPHDYLFPLAGLFYECPAALVGILSILIVGGNLKIKKIWGHNSRFVSIFTFVLLGLLTCNSILSFFNVFGFVYHIIISLYIYAFIVLIMTVFYKNKNSNTIDQMSDIGIAVVLFWVGLLFSFLNYHEATILIILMMASVMLYVSSYLITTYILVKRDKRYIHREELMTVIEEDDVDLGMRELQNKLKGENPTIISEDE